MVEVVLGNDRGRSRPNTAPGEILAPFVDAPTVAATSCSRSCAKSSVWWIRKSPQPQVLLSDDPNSHVSNLRSPPSRREDRPVCVECGYCNRLLAPAKDLTLTHAYASFFDEMADAKPPVTRNC
jgi:hypothetical protein